MHSHTYLLRAETANEDIWVANQVAEMWQQKNVQTLALAATNENTSESEMTEGHTHTYWLWVVDSWTLTRTEAGTIRYAQTGHYEEYETSGIEWTTGSTHRHTYSMHYASQASWDITGPEESTNLVPYESLSGSTWSSTEDDLLTSDYTDPRGGPNLSQVVGDHTVVTEKPVLELMRNVEVQLDGRLYVSKDGDFTYESRFHRSV